MMKRGSFATPVVRAPKLRLFAVQEAENRNGNDDLVRKYSHS